MHYSCFKVTQDSFRLRTTDQCFIIITGHGYGCSFNTDHFNHSSTCGNSRQSSNFLFTTERDLIGIGMICPDIADHKFYGNTGLSQVTFRFGQAFIIGFPTKEAAKQSHIRTLALMRGGE